VGPWYVGSFVTQGEAVLEVPAGTYTVIAERGTEYRRFEGQVVVLAGSIARRKIVLKPWINMNDLGWWSADFHVHRSLEETQKLTLAEDLNLSVVFTMWNKQNLWEGKSWPEDAALAVSPRHYVTLLNAEDERGGGAWMLHGLRHPLNLAVDGRWHPPGSEFIRQARRQRSGEGLFPWFDCEKPIWWEVPVVMALEPPDSFGVLHNHFTQYGIFAHEAWGRPRDREAYPGPDGFVEYSLGLYYRYLNLGFRLPPSAGSASGVLPNPVGYNRVYTKLTQPFTVEGWYQALRDSRGFVTNGPMLFFEAVPASRNDQVRLTVEARAREPLDRVEIIANGRLIKQFPGATGRMTFQGEHILSRAGHSWAVARCFARSEETIRLAHSAPIYLPGVWDARDDAQFFVQWLDELIAQTRADSRRFAEGAAKNAILELYGQARDIYVAKAG
jgi:hypothetical protein